MKRFTETLKWQNPWFRKLTPEAKLLWQWLLDHCDAAGVIEPDFELATFQIGVEIDSAVIDELGTRVRQLASGKLLIPAFIGFQYGRISRACRAQEKVFLSLDRHGLTAEFAEKEKGKSVLSDTLSHTLSDRVSNTLLDTQQEEEEEEEEEVKEEGCGEKPTASPSQAITAETIVGAYPVRQDTAQCIAIVEKHIAAGECAEAMLAGTRAIAGAIAQLPSGHLNKYVLGATRFFRDKRWEDDPATWLRQNAPGTTSDGSKLELGGRRPSRVVKIPHNAS
jgi:hypothetical protein